MVVPVEASMMTVFSVTVCCNVNQYSEQDLRARYSIILLKILNRALLLEIAADIEAPDELYFR
jgi:hypothetical protein